MVGHIYLNSNVSKPLDPSEPCTNDVAEIFAVIEAVKEVKRWGKFILTRFYLTY